MSFPKSPKKYQKTQKRVSLQVWTLDSPVALGQVGHGGMVGGEHAGDLLEDVVVRGEVLSSSHPAHQKTDQLFCFYFYFYFIKILCELWAN